MSKCLKDGDLFLRPDYTKDYTAHTVALARKGRRGRYIALICRSGVHIFGFVH